VRSIKNLGLTISEVEGFHVRFIGDADVERKRVGEYPYVNAANKGWTVARWRATRFEPNYPEYRVEVLDGDGQPVHGKTLLSTVRESYWDDEWDEDDGGGIALDASKHGSTERRTATPRASAPAAVAKTPGNLTLAELESRLWAAANSLRGPVDPADFKSYVFPLLFLKWISDSWDLDHAAAVADFGPDVSAEEEADYHRFDIPDGCHWSDLRKVSVNVGVTLQNTLQRLEEANPNSLAGIFGDVAWANKERLPEASLLNLIDAFDSLTLNRTVVPNDMLGAAYEYLLRQFADESGKKAGEFFTPRAVVRLLVAILDPQPGEAVYDPACGSGGMLVETINGVREAGGDTRTLRLYGQEVNLTTAAIARMNLFLHDLEDFRIVRGDTLREPRFLERSGLRRFDVVVANPPFSLKNWGADTWTADPYDRAFCGVPPANTADFAWVQHMVASMKPDTGRVGVVMPHGVLFRGGAEKAIRQCLVEQDRLEAVIGLPPNLFYSTSIPACLLVFTADKTDERRGGVVFVDGSARFVKGRNQNQMSAEDVDAILAAYRAGDDPDGEGGVKVRLAEHAEIKDNDWDLNMGRYIASTREETITVEQALAQLRDAQAALNDAEQRLDERLRAAGYE
jgi:type I restriction enzyme M protein